MYRLVTTADKGERHSNGPTLFLGKWCQSDSNKDFPLNLSDRLVPYHWDDREKFNNDQVKIDLLTEKLIPEIVLALNQLHCKNYSIKFWRILIGPWLMNFVPILFDRWEMIRIASEEFEILHSKIVTCDLITQAPSDMNEFRENIYRDGWNHAIYSTLIKDWFQLPYEKISSNSIESPKNRKFQSTLKGILKYVRSNLIAYINITSIKNKYFFLSTYLPYSSEIKLSILLGQIPIIRDRPMPTKKWQCNTLIRSKFNLNASSYLGFESFARKMIPALIPTLYLEGFTYLESRAKKTFLPHNPRVIFTSTGYNSDEVFKIWAALKVEQGAKLIVGQHGGNIGTAKFSATELHEMRISDKYITWGWGSNEKHYKLGILKKIGLTRSVNPSRHGNLLLVSSVMPKYSYVLASYTVAAGQVEENLNDQFDFLAGLEDSIRELVVVRLFSPDWGWNQKIRWANRCPDIRLDEGKRPIEGAMHNARLYVATYNGTTFLESLSQNIPTIMFWNPKHWEIRDEAIPFFTDLLRVGIFFHTPIEAANQVNRIWHDVDSWWMSSDVQNVVKLFCTNFANRDDGLLLSLKKIIEE